MRLRVATSGKPLAAGRHAGEGGQDRRGLEAEREQRIELGRECRLRFGWLASERPLVPPEVFHGAGGGIGERLWAHGGETKLSNLVTLCRFHHRLVHEGQVVIQTLDDGAFRFTRPDGESFESPLPPSVDWHELVGMNEAADIQVTPRTAITRWTGESLDLGIAVQCLMERRAGDVSAET